jgi:hypothetical protein
MPGAKSGQPASSDLTFLVMSIDGWKRSLFDQRNRKAVHVIHAQGV